MRERPIIMRAESVRAILAGRKSQTRRVVKPSNSYFNGSPWPAWAKRQCWDWAQARVDDGPSPAGNPGPYLHLPWLSGPDGAMAGTVHRIYPRSQPGDRLWVREAWAQRLDRDDMNGSQLYASGVREAWYWADGPGKCASTGCAGAAGRVRAALCMPRWASRITLEVTGVRVERLQEISGDDCIAEGIKQEWTCLNPGIGSYAHGNNVNDDFRSLWESIHGPGSWTANPWVWVIEFRRLP